MRDTEHRTPHLKIRNGYMEYDTSTPDTLIEVDFDHIADFDYVLNRITDVVRGPAYEWDGPQTMRLIAMLAVEHLEAHGQSVELTEGDITAIKEALAR